MSAPQLQKSERRGDSSCLLLAYIVLETLRSLQPAACTQR